MITFHAKGDFKKLNSWFERALEFSNLGVLDKYGKKGVQALSNATPVLTGLASKSWYYTIERKGSTVSVIWSNNDIEGGCNVALLLQYGHGTRNGGYVQGIDYINPAIRPIFEEMAKKAWKEVINA